MNKCRNMKHAAERCPHAATWVATRWAKGKLNSSHYKRHGKWWAKHAPVRARLTKTVLVVVNRKLGYPDNAPIDYDAAAAMSSESEDEDRPDDFDVRDDYSEEDEDEDDSGYSPDSEEDKNEDVYAAEKKLKEEAEAKAEAKAAAEKKLREEAEAELAEIKRQLALQQEVTPTPQTIIDAAASSHSGMSSIKFMSVKEMKAQLDEKGVDYSACIEKQDLVDLLRLNWGCRDLAAQGSAGDIDENQVVGSSNGEGKKRPRLPALGDGEAEAPAQHKEESSKKRTRSSVRRTEKEKKRPRLPALGDGEAEAPAQHKEESSVRYDKTTRNWRREPAAAAVGSTGQEEFLRSIRQQ